MGFENIGKNKTVKSTDSNEHGKIKKLKKPKKTDS